MDQVTKKMNSKYIRVKFSDGAIWDVPAVLVAHNKAEYLASEYDADYSEELFDCLGFNDEIIDWAFNNMDWEDVKTYALYKGHENNTDYEDEWCNVQHEVVEYE